MYIQWWDTPDRTVLLTPRPAEARQTNWKNSRLKPVIPSLKIDLCCIPLVKEVSLFWGIGYLTFFYFCHLVGWATRCFPLYIWYLASYYYLFIFILCIYFYIFFIFFFFFLELSILFEFLVSVITFIHVSRITLTTHLLLLGEETGTVTAL